MAGARKCGSESRERKTAVPWKGGNTFHRERKEEKERGTERVWDQVCAGQKPLQTTDWGARFLSVARFLENSLWSPNSEVLEVPDFCQGGAVACTLEEREAAGPITYKVV